MKEVCGGGPGEPWSERPTPGSGGASAQALQLRQTCRSGWGAGDEGGCALRGGCHARESCGREAQLLRLGTRSDHSGAPQGLVGED